MNDNEATDDDSRDPGAKDNSGVYEVEKILDHQVTGDNLLLHVRWSGYGSDEDTWEPEEELRDSAGEVVQEYYRKLKVNDKAELIATLQKHIKRNKKRERSPSAEEDAYQTDESDSTRKSSKKNRKSKRDTPSSSSSTPKVSTTAALKSYETPKSGNVTPNNAKRTAMEIRDNRWDSSEDDDDSNAETSQPSDIDLIHEKVRSKSNHVAVDKSSNHPPAVNSEVEKGIVGKEKSASPQPESSSSSSRRHEKSMGSRDSSLFVDRKAAAVPASGKDSGRNWTVHGIVRHTDNGNNKRKLVMMSHSETGEKKILKPKEAFELNGWALAKYLLDRCEF